MTDFTIPSPNTPDIWERLAVPNKPILIYGTGNGADKIMDELSRRDIPVAGVFASDGFVRDREFRGHRVISYGDARSRYGDFTALLAFGTSRPEVLLNIEMIASEVTLLCPDVPAFGDVIFDSRYYRENHAAFENLAASLADDESRRVLSLILEYKLTGELPPLLASASGGDPSVGILAYEKYKNIVDLGAYTGDTVRAAIEKMQSLQKVIALEPEPHAYRKLRAYADTVANPQLVTYNAAAWSHNTTLDFTAGSGRGSSASARTHKGAQSRTVDALAVDKINEVADTRIDFIKFDVEGAEAEALRGASATIRRDSPDLLVSVYHRTEDILSLSALVSELCPAHRLYLRREPGVPAWGINLYAISE